MKVPAKVKPQGLSVTDLAEPENNTCPAGFIAQAVLSKYSGIVGAVNSIKILNAKQQIMEYFKSLKLMKPRSFSQFINRVLGIGKRDIYYERAKEQLENELDIIEVIKKLRKIEIVLKFILNSHHIKFLPIIGSCVVSKEGYS